MRSNVSFNENVVVNLLENSSQKCYLSRDMMLSLGCCVGDYVSIHCIPKTVICKIYCKSSVDFVEADESVVSRNQHEDDGFYTAHFPLDFTLLPVEPMGRIEVSVVFSDLKKLTQWKSIEKLKTYVQAILSQYVVASGYTVNCQKHNVGRICGINKIQILNTFRECGIVGKVESWTIIHITSTEIEEFDNPICKRIKLGGLDDVVTTLKSTVENMKSIEHELGPRILLTGPPGCGKSSLVTNIAHQTNTHLITSSPSNLCRMCPSDCKKFFSTVQHIGQLSSKIPCILFIDDLDLYSTSKNERSKMLYFTSALIDLCKEYKDLIVFAAAHSSRNLHPSLKRFGSFTKEVHLGVPTLEQRVKILEVQTGDLDVNVDLKKIAQETPGCVGSDLFCLVQNAKHIVRNTQSADNEEQKDSHVKSVTTADFEKALTTLKPSILKQSKFRTNVKPVLWDEIGGLEAIKQRAKMYIEWPILCPSQFAKVGLPRPKGVLLFGPPGCCKTTLVRVLATECKANFFSASPADIYTCYVGDSEKSIIELFHQARLCAPSIIFLDEIDSLMGRRSYSGGDKGVHEKVLTALLSEMDGFGVKMESLQGVANMTLEENDHGPSSDTDGNRSAEHVIVVGATNRIDLIDDALIRPGRFDSLLYVAPPNVQERKAVLQTIAKNMNLENHLLEWLAEKTEFFSGADLKDLCRIAALSAMKKQTKVAKEHFEMALKIRHPSITAAQLKNYETWASKYGPIISAK